MLILIGFLIVIASVSRVVGLASSVLFDRQNPQNPINRRISIVVMTAAADTAFRADTAPHGHGPDARATAGPARPILYNGALSSSR